MDQVRIGIIGVGGMGSNHCATMRDVEEATLTAVCDIVPSVVAEVAAKYEAPGFERAEDLLDSGLVDAVIIATPHYDHTPIAIQAFERGIHVLSEKPVAVSVSEADRMIAAAAESGRKFAVMYQMRSLGRAQAARKVVEEGRLGEIYRTSLVMGWFRTQAYYDSGGWRATWAGEGGGVLINQAPHFLDLFCWLAGMPSKVTGHTRTRLHDIEVEDEAFAFLEYSNGAHGYLYASTTESPQHEMMEICGDKGKLVMHGAGLRFLENRPTVREFALDSDEMWAKPQVDVVELEIPEQGGSHTDITRNFCRAVLYDEPLLTPGEEGIWSVELFNAINLSSHTNQPAKIPLDRHAYDELLARLQESSRRKDRIREQRVTDPIHLRPR